MKILKTVAVSTVLGSPAMADQQAVARDLLAMWQPQSVAIDGGVLTVVLPQNRISEEMYMAVLTSGLCLGFALDKPLNGLSGVEVLINTRGRATFWNTALPPARHGTNARSDQRQPTMRSLARPTFIDG